MPVEQAGVASGIFNVSKEVAGLLGITVIRGILTARKGALLRQEHPAATAFLLGYQIGLAVAAMLVAAGGLAAWTAMQQTYQREATPGVAPVQPKPGEAAPLCAFEVVANGAGSHRRDRPRTVEGADDRRPTFPEAKRSALMSQVKRHGVARRFPYDAPGDLSRTGPLSGTGDRPVAKPDPQKTCPKWLISALRTHALCSSMHQ